MRSTFPAEANAPRSYTENVYKYKWCTRWVRYEMSEVRDEENSDLREKVDDSSLSYKFLCLSSAGLVFEEDTIV